MNTSIYHLGITPPPDFSLTEYKIHYYPLIEVNYDYFYSPLQIEKKIQLYKDIIILSKNSVFGLARWMEEYQIKIDFFSNHLFRTVGNETSKCLKQKIGLKSLTSKIMTGEGLIDSICKQKVDKIFLISSHDSKSTFINKLNEKKINYFHFPVYKISIKRNTLFYPIFVNLKSNFIILTSPLMIRALLYNLSISDLSSIKCKMISIGPTTSREIEKHGGRVFFESEKQSIVSLYKRLVGIIRISSK